MVSHNLKTDRECKDFHSVEGACEKITAVHRLPFSNRNQTNFCFPRLFAVHSHSDNDKRTCKTSTHTEPFAHFPWECSNCVLTQSCGETSTETHT